MKKLHIAAITVSGLAAALVGLAAHASPTELPTVSPIASGIEHHHSIDDFQPTVTVPKVDTSVRHGPLTLSSTQGHPSPGAPVVRAPGLGTAINRSNRRSRWPAG